MIGGKAAPTPGLPRPKLAAGRSAGSRRAGTPGGQARSAAAVPTVGRPGWIAEGVGTLGFLFYTDAFLPSSRFITGTDPEAGTFDPLNTMAQAGLLLWGLVFVIRNRRAFLERLLRFLPFWLVLAAILVSVAWSVAPENTIRRGLGFLTFLLFITWVDTAFGFRRSMVLLLRAVVIAAASGLVLLPLAPHLALDTGDYATALRGVFAQKNGLGAAMLVGVLAWAAAAIAEGRLGVGRTLVCFALLGFAVLSQSTTSLLLALITLGVGVVLVLAPRYAAAALAMKLGLLVGGLILVMTLPVVGPEELLGLIGKDATLTGRTDLWEAVLAAVRERPYFGYGYSAFWIEGQPGPSMVWDRIGWKAPTTHNGMLEILVQLGLLGALLVAVLLATTLRLLVLTWTSPAGPVAQWTVLFLAVHLFLNVNESMLLTTNAGTLLWALAMLTLTAAVPARSAVPPVRPPLRLKARSPVPFALMPPPEGEGQ